MVENEKLGCCSPKAPVLASEASGNKRFSSFFRTVHEHLNVVHTINSYPWFIYLVLYSTIFWRKPFSVW